MEFADTHRQSLPLQISEIVLDLDGWTDISILDSVAHAVHHNRSQLNIVDFYHGTDWIDS